LKQIKNEKVSNLEETFKPITEPLHELLTENKKLNKKEYINDTHDIKTKFKKVKIRVPKSKKEKRVHERVIESDSESDAYVDAFSQQSLIDESDVLQQSLIDESDVSQHSHTDDLNESKKPD